MEHFVENGHMKKGHRRVVVEGSPAARPHRATAESVVAFRNVRGELLGPSSVTASEAKNEFARMLEIVTRGGVVVITKHDAPKAVLMSVENFNALATSAATKLDALDEEFDALLARMQTSRSRRGMNTAFAASGKQLGEAAVAATRKRGS